MHFLAHAGNNVFCFDFPDLQKLWHIATLLKTYIVLQTMAKMPL